MLYYKKRTSGRSSGARKALPYRKLEQFVRGFSNHRRIKIMEILDQEPELSVEELTERLDSNYKTAADHIRRLALAGLVMKRTEGTAVRHRLTPRGGSILKFLRTLE